MKTLKELVSELIDTVEIVILMLQSNNIVDDLIEY